LPEEAPDYWPIPLPDYDRPPVVETVMAVHFARLRQLTSVELLEFWRSTLREAYPVASERAAYQVPVELFEAPGEQLQIQMELSPSPDRMRYWFQSESNENLVQLQNDWLAFNWRKASPETGYRHYSYGVERFEELYVQLERFCQQAGLGRITPQQIEISYINHISSADGGWQDHADLGRILKVIGADAPGGSSPPGPGDELRGAVPGRSERRPAGAALSRCPAPLRRRIACVHVATDLSRRAGGSRPAWRSDSPRPGPPLDRRRL
jgi:hypothetical protein